MVTNIVAKIPIIYGTLLKHPRKNLFPPGIGRMEIPCPVSSDKMERLETWLKHIFLVIGLYDGIIVCVRRLLRLLKLRVFPWRFVGQLHCNKNPAECYACIQRTYEGALGRCMTTLDIVDSTRRWQSKTSK